MHAKISNLPSDKNPRDNPHMSKKLDLQSPDKVLGLHYIVNFYKTVATSVVVNLSPLFLGVKISNNILERHAVIYLNKEHVGNLQVCY